MWMPSSVGDHTRQQLSRGDPAVRWLAVAIGMPCEGRSLLFECRHSNEDFQWVQHPAAISTAPGTLQGKHESLPEKLTNACREVFLTLPSRECTDSDILIFFLNAFVRVGDRPVSEPLYDFLRLYFRLDSCID